ncbi:hypothetical protein SynMITS9220_02213 [Synechococcus sp. MIT S9220]|nr:hypothetical protein SynMITS9220_02213 [Synechococcus sp. MIT S9220]
MQLLTTPWFGLRERIQMSTHYRLSLPQNASLQRQDERSG